MSEQYIKGVQKWQTAHKRLMDSTIALLFNDQEADNISIGQRIEVKMWEWIFEALIWNSLSYQTDVPLFQGKWQFIVSPQSDTEVTVYNLTKNKPEIFFMN